MTLHLDDLCTRESMHFRYQFLSRDGTVEYGATPGLTINTEPVPVLNGRSEFERHSSSIHGPDRTRTMVGSPLNPGP